MAEDAHLACEMSMDVAGQCGAEIDVEQDVPARCWDEQALLVESAWTGAKEPARSEPAEPSEPQSHERVPSGSRDEQVPVEVSPWTGAKEPARGEPAESSGSQSHGERVPSGSRDEQVLVATAASQIEVHGDYWWSFP